MRPSPTGASRLRADKTARITPAVLTLLGERGWDGLTMDAVAARAGVGKPALYRRWESKDAMVLDCIETLASVMSTVPDTGHLRGDLLSLAQQSADYLRDPVAGPVISAVNRETHRRPSLAALVTNRVSTPHRTAVRLAFDRAIHRGEATPDTDVELATDLLAAPFYMFSVAADRDVPTGYAERLVDAILRAFGTHPRPPAPTPVDSRSSGSDRR